MSEEIKHEQEIKAVLDHQLVNLRTYNMDRRAPAQDMAGLHSTYGYDRSEMSKVNEMLKTGQVAMDVDAMPGLVEDASDAEEFRGRGRRKCPTEWRYVLFLLKKLVIRRGTAGNLKNGRRKTPTRNTSRPSILCYSCGKEGHILGSAEENLEIKEGEGMADSEADRWRRWSNPWQ